MHDVTVEFMNPDDRRLGLCWVTHLAIFRLVTNPAVMGADALTRHEAWRLQDDLRAGDRVVWLEEPPGVGVEQVWRALSAAPDRSHKLWTDDYLAAFAQNSGIPLATLDQRIAPRYPAVDVVTIR